MYNNSFFVMPGIIQEGAPLVKAEEVTVMVQLKTQLNKQTVLSTIVITSVVFVDLFYR